MKVVQFLQNAATGALVLCAVAVTAVLLRREFFPGAVSAARPEGDPIVADWRMYGTGSNRAGPDDAPVTIVEFSDFQCPFCQEFAARLDTIQAENPRTVRVVYRHYPLPRHPHAETAALASECAAAQNRFWAMHDALFAGQDSIGQRPWRSYASAAGVRDLSAFERCIEQRDGEAALRRDIGAGTRLHVQGTPTILINGRRVRGAPQLDSLRAYVHRARVAAVR